MCGCAAGAVGTDTIITMLNLRSGHARSHRAAQTKHGFYFDNDREGFAIKNARELIRQLRERGHDIA
jgi:hypothetical protein